MKYLDYTGLTKLWNKIKSLLNNKVDKIEGGTSSLFLKADGSVDDIEYLPITGGRIVSENTTHPLNISSTTESNVVIYFYNKDNQEHHAGYVGYIGGSTGISIRNAIANKSFDIKDDGSLMYDVYKVWHEGNDGAGSGLDADTLDGKQPSDLNVLSANILQGENMAEVESPSHILAENFKEAYRSYIKRYNGSNAGLFRYPVSIIVNGAWQKWELTFTEHTNRTDGNLYFRTTNTDGWYDWHQIAFTDSNVASSDVAAELKRPSAWIKDFNSDAETVSVKGWKIDSENRPNDNYGVAYYLSTDYANSQWNHQLAFGNDGNLYLRRKIGDHDWTSWRAIAFTDSNVPSSNITMKSINHEEDLDNIKDVRLFGVYYCTYPNNLKNTPFSESTSIRLICYGSTDDYVTQIIENVVSGNIYTRVLINNVWKPWRKIQTADDPVISLNTQQLRDEDLNDIKDANFSTYWAEATNTCANKPNDVDAFSLQVIRYATNTRFQMLTDQYANVYKRKWNSANWSPWKKMLTEDDISDLITRIENLESKNS